MELSETICEEGETEENCPEDCTVEKQLPTGMLVLSPTKISIVTGAVVITVASIYLSRKE